MTHKKLLLITGLTFELHHHQMKAAEEYSWREELDDGCKTPHQFRDHNAIHRQGKRRKRK